MVRGCGNHGGLYGIVWHLEDELVSQLIHRVLIGCAVQREMFSISRAVSSVQLTRDIHKPTYSALQLKCSYILISSECGEI